MKKIAWLVFVFGFVLALPARKLLAQQSFEGTFTWSMIMPTMDSEQHSMIVNVKGDKSESETDMGEMGMTKFYQDRSARKMYVVIPAMKMGMVADMSDSELSAGVNADSLDLKPTGKKEIIAGYHAEEYLLKGLKDAGMKNFGEVSLWVTPDFPKDIRQYLTRSLNSKPGQDPKQTKAMKQFAGRGLVPVRMVVKRDGEVEVSMEFVKYEKKNLDDSLFVPPVDINYTPVPAGAGSSEN